VGRPDEKSHLADLGVDGGIILNFFKEMKWRGMDWIILSQDRDM